jgi:hypothetical protein
MKSFPGSFGFEAFLIYFVPGALVLLSLVMVLMVQDTCRLMLPNGVCTDIGKTLGHSVVKDTEFIIFTISTILSGVFGCIIAVLAQWVEEEFLDPIVSSIIWKEYGDYLSEEPMYPPEQRGKFINIWHWYIANLQALKNSYISKLVLRLHFTTRIGIASAFLVIPLTLFKLYVLAAVVAFVVVFLLWGAYRASYSLGVFRLILYLKQNDYESYQQLVDEKNPIGAELALEMEE